MAKPATPRGRLLLDRARLSSSAANYRNSIAKPACPTHTVVVRLQTPPGRSGLDLSLELHMSHNTIADEPHAPARDLAPTKRRLTAQLGRSEHQILELELVLSDPDTIQEDRDNARAVLDSIRADVFQIRRALARVESGDYGRCATCGCSIPDERLQMIPFVAHCTRCA